MAIPLRADFDAVAVRSWAKKSKDGPQARRLLALAAIYQGASRTEAVKIGGVRRAPSRPRRDHRERSDPRCSSLFMGSCGGGSSISANGSSRNSASSSPGRP